MNDLILYTTEDGRSQIKLRALEQTVWLTQLEMAELFDATKQNISLHLKNVFEDGELDPVATVKESLTVQTEGARQVQRPVTLYNLDAILAVGYRVRSPRGVQFRRWASTILREYLVKGFVMDDERLKNPDGRPDYFDEMLERIRDIRASEKRFYQKVRDLFSLSSDYDKTDQATQTFFATVQNLLLYAVTQKTAAELIATRADGDDPNFGLLHWKGAKVRKADIVIAKNYLTEDEIDTLNRLVVIFLETAELRAKSRQETRMSFWKGNVDQIITSNGFPLLTHAGTISHEEMEQRTAELYLDYDRRRKTHEAQAADHQDEAEAAADLQALETKLKRRTQK
ncbi:virulence RhuM family protein [Brevifollis gellanilyticus]|uniref:DNA-binding protein n=1 Tax=Brevifollis gellanilyticus TaxID=748831 RepID=A0A512MIC1_9BACT|nr:virulence RhuM family protein [Brevifollis gellanilyticus]GEP46486.1 DNA-binding protein [Brevifollis gellanilyticus]